MGMYEELMAYYDSQELSKLQEDWKNLRSHKFGNGICIEELLASWEAPLDCKDFICHRDNEKININEKYKAPLTPELFLS